MKLALEKFKRLMQVSSPDLEDARRRNLLNIFLASTFASAIVMLAILELGILAQRWTIAEASHLVILLIPFLIATVAIFLINRQWGKPAIFLFLFLYIFGYALCDTPVNLADGSTVFFFALPIVVASLLVFPAASFIVAAIGSLILTWANAVANPGSTPNFVTMIGFFMLALMSWLTSRSLENALRNLQKSHAELDRQVEHRTRALANSLQREQAEAVRSRAILASLADGVIVFDHDGAAIVVNPACAQLLDLPVERIIGSSIAKLLQSQQLQPASRTILAGLLSGSSPQTVSGNIGWAHKTLSVSSACVKDDLGQSIGTVAVFHDYTQAAEVDRMKNSFVAIVSHELRTPLNAIYGYTEMLGNGAYGPVNEQQAIITGKIMSNTHRLLDIVSDLLDQTQMEAGKLALHNQPFRPVKLIEDIRSLMEKTVTDKGLVLTTQVDSRLPDSLMGDGSRLQQILVNLINNGVKFTEKGSIHVSLSCSGDGYWTLGVQDTGIGIPEAELSTIFEAFRQVDNLTTRRYGGFGLGLAIVKQLTGVMDGKIAVTSKLGAGTTFILTLPLVPAV
jgi:signal transduction histidine kinase